MIKTTQNQIEKKRQQFIQTNRVLISEDGVPRQVFQFIKSQKQLHESKLGGMKWNEDDL